MKRIPYIPSLNSSAARFMMRCLILAASVDASTLPASGEESVNFYNKNSYTRDRVSL